MMNWSSLSKSVGGNALAAIAILVALAGVTLEWPVLSVVALGMAACGLGISMFFVSHAHRVIAQMQSICARMAQGNFQERIVGPHESGVLGELQKSLNSTMERCESFVRKMEGVCGRIAKGDFEACFLNAAEDGDFSKVQKLLNDMVDRCDAFVREATATMQAVRDNKGYRRILPQGLHGALLAAARTINEATVVVKKRKDEVHLLASEFEAGVGTIVETVASASNKLEAAAGTLTTTAGATRQLSGSAAAASDEAAANVNSVASASEELAGSVNEIARQVQESSRIANEAVRQAQQTDARINELSAAASRIGDVVKLITSVAEQTNLLALNATIEAARAGEAGKGFAVVAHEVKALAAQTAAATNEISTQITGIQTATQEAVAAIKTIGGTIGRISEIASAIAASAEQQGTATREISRNVQQAAQGTAQVATNITDVNRGAGETGSAAAEVLSFAQSLSSESHRLRMEVGKFLSTVRAA
jgi:methyl-accepting chemotaxis protein